MNNLTQAIDQYKRDKGIKSDAELAERWGICPDYLSKIRRGIRQPGNLIWKAIVNDAPCLTPYMLLYFQKERADFNAMKKSGGVRG